MNHPNLDAYRDAGHVGFTQLTAVLNCPHGQIWGEVFTRKGLPKPTAVNCKFGWKIGAVRKAMR